MNGTVRVTFTLAEAERLYASAALYESTVHRIVGVAEADQLAASALTKLAGAIHQVDTEVEKAIVGLDRALADTLNDHPDVNLDEVLRRWQDLRMAVFP